MFQLAIVWLISTGNDGNRIAIEKNQKAGSDIELDLCSERSALHVDLLCHFLRLERALTSLSFDLSDVSDLESSRIFNSLLIQNVLTELRIEGWVFDTDLIKIIAGWLKESKSIETLCFDGNQLRTDDLIIICNSLLECQTIRSLSLLDQDLELESIAVISDFVEQNPHLESLEISECEFGDLLAEKFKNNKSLKSITFRSCSITNQGARDFSHLLIHNSVLKRLDLLCNNIDLVGMQYLAEALTQNQSLEYLMVHLNSDCDSKPDSKELSIDLESLFAQALAKNASLLCLAAGTSVSASLIMRNRIDIPIAARRSALYLIGVTRSTNYDGMGLMAVFPKEIVEISAKEVWATRKDPVWIQALE